MLPPVYQTCIASTAVTDIVGLKIYEDEAEQGAITPYVVWQQIGGVPENFINEIPDLDSISIQFDAYADDQATAESLVIALRNAIEPVAHIMAWRGKSREKDTRLYRFSFDVDWMVGR